MSADEYLTLSQVAGRLNIRERVISGLVHTGQIPHKRIGKAIRFRWAEVQAWWDTLPGRPAEIPATPIAIKRISASPDDTLREVIPLVRGPKRKKIAPSVQQTR